MPKRTSAAEATPLRVVIVTLDSHLAGTVERAAKRLKRELPGLDLSMHAAADWGRSEDALRRCREAVAEGDIVVVTMLFMEEHIQPILPWLEARRDRCDAMVVGMSAGEVIRLTRLGRLSMDGKQSGMIELLKRLRGSKTRNASSGARQMAMLRRLPRLLRFIPGTAQDLRSYFLTLQYWLAASDKNVANMVRLLVDRYADGPRRALRGQLKVGPPAIYPDVGIYHPSLRGKVAEQLDRLPRPPKGCRGRVGLIVMRSYVLAGDTGHYDGIVAALEARGYEALPVFACGLDSRPAVEAYFIEKGRPRVDAVVSLTGFSLVGGPAYNDSKAAEDTLAKLDVPYLAAQAVEFQSLEQWQASERGLLPIEATMMVAIPELDGSIGPMVFGGRTTDAAAGAGREMQADPERAEMLAARVDRLISLRKTAKADRKLAVVLFNFPPNAGSTGTAAHLSVFESLHRTLQALAADGYDVELPASVGELQARIVAGNANRFGTDANVHCRIPTDDHVRRETWLPEIESQWGPAPGRQQSDGSALFVLGAAFGKVFVGIQPAFGYEGDPMRLLFDKGFAPTHAFSAFYRYLREDFGADAVLHFGTHGALEFMPGKQTGLTQACWPDRLIGDLPNFYLYAANNPSEGTIAKRRAAATLISHLTPPVAHAGLYRSLLDLKDSIERWRSLPPDAAEEQGRLVVLIQEQAAALDLADAEPAWLEDAEGKIARLTAALRELEQTLVPQGLHIVGQVPSDEERAEYLQAMAEDALGGKLDRAALDALLAGRSPEDVLTAAGLTVTEDRLALFRSLSETSRLLAEDHELPALLHALDGRYVRPVPGGDLLRTPQILPTGRNVHGFDPYRIPSAFATADGKRQAERLLDRHTGEGNAFPESIALVLWGSDNLKTEGGPIGQALALLGAEPRFDSYGRLAGAVLIPLEELGRPRVDVVITLSGIFRDLLPVQTKMLAEAAFLAASADEPVEENFVRKHALAYQQAHDCDLETAALRIFSNADGTYGSNVNHLVDCGRWSDEDELAEIFTERKSFAYGRDGESVQQTELLQSVLSEVQLSYQNLESLELGVTTVDHYFDSLGGISRAVARAKGTAIPVYIGDQTQGEGKVRTLAEQVALETRTRTLNPKWYEGLLSHGFEGVRQIEAQVTNTMGWSATTGQVDPWVYHQITQTYVLDEEMRERLAQLNPKASAKVAHRLLEAQERNYWRPDESMLEALRRAGEELEDRLEGIGAEAAA